MEKTRTILTVSKSHGIESSGMNKIHLRQNRVRSCLVFLTVFAALTKFGAASFHASTGTAFAVAPTSASLNNDGSYARRREVVFTSSHRTATVSPLFAAKRKVKDSATGRRKKRARKVIKNFPGTMPGVDDFSGVVSDPIDGATSPKAAARQTAADTKRKEREDEKQGNEAASKECASQIIETQRKSVAMLAHVRERVESLPFDDIASALTNTGYYVKDNLLGEESILAEMAAEGVSMLSSDKLQLEEIGSGMYSTLLKGGQERYADSPRCVEFVVSATRHMPPLFNEALKKANAEKGDEDNVLELDNTASMGSLRTFDRKARLAAVKLLMGNDDGVDEKELASKKETMEYVTGGDTSDARRVTLIYYITPPGWDAETCGGALRIQTTENGPDVAEPRRDRCVVFWSDRTLQGEDVWRGRDGMDYASCLVVHFVNKL